MAKVTQINAPIESLALRRVSNIISEQEGNIAFFSLPHRCEAIQQSGISQRLFTGDSRFTCVQQFINEALKLIQRQSVRTFILDAIPATTTGRLRLEQFAVEYDVNIYILRTCSDYPHKSLYALND